MLLILLGYGHGTAGARQEPSQGPYCTVCWAQGVGSSPRAASCPQHPSHRPPTALFQQLPGEECLFLERLEENHYNTYISKKHADKNWFVGLKKNGNSKLGPRTHYGQKAILFLPLPVSAD